MTRKGKDKKMIEVIAGLKDTGLAGSSPELAGIHSRLLKGRNSFEGVMTGNLTSAMNISNLDLQVSDRVDEISIISDDLSTASADLNHISAEAAAVTKPALFTLWPRRA